MKSYSVSYWYYNRDDWADMTVNVNAISPKQAIKKVKQYAPKLAQNFEIV